MNWKMGDEIGKNFIKKNFLLYILYIKNCFLLELTSNKLLLVIYSICCSCSFQWFSSSLDSLFCFALLYFAVSFEKDKINVVSVILCNANHTLNLLCFLYSLIHLKIYYFMLRFCFCPFIFLFWFHPIIFVLMVFLSNKF